MGLGDELGLGEVPQLVAQGVQALGAEGPRALVDEGVQAGAVL